MNSTLFQWVLVTLAALSAFTLSPARSGVRDLVSMAFLPVAWPVHGTGLWLSNRLAPRREPDMLSPTNPRTVDELRRQNAELLVHVANLEAQIEDLRQFSAQYRMLGADLQKRVRPAMVMTTPAAGQQQVLTIKTSGISPVREKMAVIHPLGFAGQISSVAPGGATARVTLVTDTSSRLTARFARFVTRADGVMGTQVIDIKPPLVEGDGKNLVVKLLPARDVRAKLKVGDVALLDDPQFSLPALKGLRLGTIRRINLPQTDAGTATIELEPTASFNTLSEVLLVSDGR